MQTYLRVEAQNMGNTLFDTDKLPILRGGSLMLRNAIRGVEQLLVPDHADRVRVGAEAAVFKLKGDPEDAIQRVRTHLAANAKQFTFAVVAVNAKSDVDGMDRALALARWQQGRRPRLAPEPDTGSDVCAYTRVRAAESTDLATGKPVSYSALNRGDYGREQRHAFYLAEAGADVADGLRFVDDLEELTSHSPYRALEGKMAVIVMDGNSFGELARSLGEGGMRGFDRRMADYRRALLTRILRFMTDPAAPKNERRNGSRLRLEVLLWAGDEFQLMVPAWLAIPLVQAIFDEVAGWRVSDAANAEALTLSAGVLICNHKLPINRAIKLASDLQYRAKSVAKTAGLANVWDYLVLESVDYPAALSLGSYWNRRIGTNSEHPGPSPLRPCPDFGAALLALERALDASDSRRKVYASAQLIAKPDSLFAPETEKWQKTKEAQAVKEALERLFPGHSTEFDLTDAVWLHLRELWDYILPAKDREEVHA